MILLHLCIGRCRGGISDIVKFFGKNCAKDLRREFRPRIEIHAQIDDLAPIERGRPSSEQLRHQFRRHLHILVLGLYNIQSLSDEDAFHRRDRFVDCLLVRAGHLTDDIRLHTIARLKCRLYPLDLCAVGSKVRPLLRTQTDAEILSRSNNAFDICTVTLKLPLCDEECSAHIALHQLMQDVIERLLLRQTAKCEYNNRSNRVEKRLTLR